MIRNKQAALYAKSLLKLSFEAGRFSEQKAGAVLQCLEKNPPRNYLLVLKEYHRLVEREAARTTAVVEHAGELDPSVVANIEARLTSRYGQDIGVSAQRNDALIAGLRVKVGCDVYDASVAASLETLETTLSS